MPMPAIAAAERCISLGSLRTFEGTTTHDCHSPRKRGIQFLPQQKPRQDLERWAIACVPRARANQLSCAVLLDGKGNVQSERTVDKPGRSKRIVRHSPGICRIMQAC